VAVKDLRRDPKKVHANLAVANAVDLRNHPKDPRKVPVK
jgi:hypothetical protein